MSHDLGTVTIFRLLGLGYYRERIRIKISVRIKVRVRVRIRDIRVISLKYKRIQNYKSLKIVTLPKT
jgi:hypothetical protein